MKIEIDIDEEIEKFKKSLEKAQIKLNQAQADVFAISGILKNYHELKEKASKKKSLKQQISEEIQHKKEKYNINKKEVLT